MELTGWQVFVQCLGCLYLAEIVLVVLWVGLMEIAVRRKARIVTRALIAHMGAQPGARQIEELKRSTICAGEW